MVRHGKVWSDKVWVSAVQSIVPSNLSPTLGVQMQEELAGHVILTLGQHARLSIGWFTLSIPTIPIPHSNIYQQPYITTTFENIRPVKTYPFPHPLWFYLGQPAIILKDACFHLLKPRNLQAVKWARRPLFCIRNLYIYIIILCIYIYIIYKRMLFTIKIRFA